MKSTFLRQIFSYLIISNPLGDLKIPYGRLGIHIHKSPTGYTFTNPQKMVIFGQKKNIGSNSFGAGGTFFIRSEEFIKDFTKKKIKF